MGGLATQGAQMHLVRFRADIRARRKACAETDNH